MPTQQEYVNLFQFVLKKSLAITKEVLNLEPRRVVAAYCHIATPNCFKSEHKVINDLASSVLIFREMRKFSYFKDSDYEYDLSTFGLGFSL